MGTNHSSTFHLQSGPKGLQSVFITFGSGTIEAIVAQEKVAVGHLSVDMNGGILLMVARNLNIAGKFEGILGLGLPASDTKDSHKSKDDKRTEEASEDDETSAQIKDMIKKITGGIFGGDEKGNLAASPDSFEGNHMAKDGPKFPDLAQDRPQGVDDIGDMIDTLDGDIRLGSPLALAPKLSSGFGQLPPMGLGHQLGHRQDPKEIGPTGLLEQAGISRFSMCFNDGASGALNLNTPVMPDSLGSVGKFHWGLDFRGITIGDEKVPLSFCSAQNMTNGQETPCGAIPDSGTTVIMAPKDQLSVLLDAICDSWPRCAANFSAMSKAAEAAKQSATAAYSWDPFEITPAAKSSILQLLLLDCGSWLEDSSGLNELPSLKFTMSGADGKQRDLELPGWAYVLESTKDVAQDNKNLQSMPEIVLMQNSTVPASQKVCSPAFGAMDYNTQKNGPVWILGTPFFYQYHVGYDLASTPPGISFTSTETTPCVACGGDPSLISTVNTKRRPRWISGPVRIPDIDVTIPL